MVVMAAAAVVVMLILLVDASANHKLNRCLEGCRTRAEASGAAWSGCTVTCGPT
jgi:hypothetical protein